MAATPKTKIHEMLGTTRVLSKPARSAARQRMGELKGIELSDQTAIPNKYKELIGVGVSGATRCRYCVLFHTEAARLFGATDDEIAEASLMAKHTMGWSTYLNARQFDYDRFTHEVDQITAYISKQAAAPA